MLKAKLTWAEYQQIISFKQDRLFEFKMSLFNLMFPLEDCENISSSELSKRTRPIFDLVKSVKRGNNLQDELEVNGIGKLFLKPIAQMNLGEYIDLEHFIIKKNNDRLLALIYRKKESPLYEKDVWEEWGGYSHKREFLFDDMDASIAVSAVNEILKQREDFLSKHKGIFSQDIQEDIDLEKIDEKEKKLIEKEEQQDKIKQALNFEFLIHSVTNGDILKIEDVLKMNVDLLFKFLLVDKQYNLIYYK